MKATLTKVILTLALCMSTFGATSVSPSIIDYTFIKDDPTSNLDIVNTNTTQAFNNRTEINAGHLNIIEQEIKKRESEPNDESDTADRLESGQRVNGTIVNDSDLDAFSIKLQDDDSFMVVFTKKLEKTHLDSDFRLTKGDPLNIALFEPDGSRILIGEKPTVTASPGETKSFTLFPGRPGEYYVVIGEGSGVGTYSIYIEKKNSSENSVKELNNLVPK